MQKPCEDDIPPGAGTNRKARSVTVSSMHSGKFNSIQMNGVDFTYVYWAYEIRNAG